MPNAWAGQPIAPASGRANVASSTTTPKNTMSAPTRDQPDSSTMFGASRGSVEPVREHREPDAISASRSPARTANGRGADRRHVVDGGDRRHRAPRASPGQRRDRR